MSDKKQYHRAFNHKFFKKNQSFLRFLLNAPILKYWFRWVLCIKKFDCKISEFIETIRPNSYTVFLGRIKGKRRYRTDFRTHEKYGKRLYHAFKPMWWVMHFLDWVLLDKWIPNLSFGFTTLTEYPDAGTGGTTVDGQLYRAGLNETWADKRDNAGSVAQPVGTFSYFKLNAGSVTDRWNYIFRQIYLFDTSAIDTDIKDSATMSLYISVIIDNFNQSISLCGSTPASNSTLEPSDYQQLGTTRYATDLDVTNLTDYVYNAWTLNATGLTNIDGSGITKLGSRYSGDIDNSMPTWASSVNAQVAHRLADYTGTVNDPKLVVEHSPDTQDYFKELTETIPLVSGEKSTTGKKCLESIPLVENKSFAVATVRTEQVDPVDTIISGSGATKTETIAIVPLYGWSGGKVITQVVSIVDSVFKSFARILSEVIAIVAEVFNQIIFLKGLSEVVSLIDSISYAIGKVITQVVSIVSISLGAIQRVLIESITIVSAVGHGFFSLCTGIINLVSSFLGSAGKVCSQIVTIVAVSTGTINRVFVEVMSIVSSMGKIPARICTEAISLVSSFLGGVGKVIVAVIDIVDSFVSSWGLILLEVITLVSSFLKTTATALIETVTITQTIIKSVALKAFAETVTIVSKISRSMGRIYVEVIVIVSTLIRGSGKVLLSTISIMKDLKLYLNGFFAGRWKKSEKKTTTWTKQDKPPL